MSVLLSAVRRLGRAPRNVVLGCGVAVLPKLYVITTFFANVVSAKASEPPCVSKVLLRISSAMPPCISLSKYSVMLYQCYAPLFEPLQVVRHVVSVLFPPV